VTDAREPPARDGRDRDGGRRRPDAEQRSEERIHVTVTPLTVERAVH
jgi:hypothetical protein